MKEIHSNVLYRISNVLWVTRVFILNEVKYEHNKKFIKGKQRYFRIPHSFNIQIICDVAKNPESLHSITQLQNPIYL